MQRLDIFVLVVALLNVGVVLVLVRRRQLREKYALLWLSVGIGGIMVGLGRTLVDRVAHAIGVSYGPSAVFLVAILFLLLVSMHLSWEVSRLEEHTKTLAQELALLRGDHDAANGLRNPSVAPVPAATDERVAEKA